MKTKHWVGGLIALVAVLAIGAGYAATHQAQVLLAVGKLRQPKVGPYREIAWSQGPATPPAGERPPNIIVILADDMGFNDITFNGGGVAGGLVPTPNIDAIGKEGAAFVNGYAANATCAPSRASIMTGRYSTRVGYEFTPTPKMMPKIVSSFPSDDDIKIEYLADVDKASPRTTMAVPTSEVFLSQILKARGYHTLHFGKWHLGTAPGTLPHDKGFDESVGGIRAGSVFLPENDPNVVNSKQDWDPIDHVMWSLLPYQVEFNGGPLFRPRGYTTDYFTDEAVKTIHANRNRPFFMYFAPNAIHSPLQATKADYDALPQIKDHRLRVYGAMVRNLDRNVGRILAALKAEGLDQNTMVIFTSDNGGAGYLGLPDLNKPYRGWKMTFFEGGIHAPYFIRWPGTIAPGTRYPHPVSGIDIFSTAAGAAGAPLPKDRVIDGVNLIPYVTGKATGRAHQTLFWRSGQYKMVIDGDWKLQSCEACKKVWLYDLAADPTERNELSAERPDKVKALLALLAAQDKGSKPLWPSILRGPTPVDHTTDKPLKRGEEYVLWDN